MIEVGASIIYSGNRYVSDFTDMLGLSKIKVSGGWFGLWDGSGFAYESKPSKAATGLSFLYRYASGLLGLQKVIKKDFHSFLQIYDQQAEGKTYETPEELWQGLGLWNHTQKTITQYLKEEGVEGRIVSEFVNGVNKANYNQGNGLNGLAGAVSLCPIVTGDLFIIKEGNVEMVKKLAWRSASQIQLGATVTKIRIHQDNRYEVQTRTVDVGDKYDAVIIAAPLELTDLIVERVNEDGSTTSIPLDFHPVEYQVTHSNWFRGELNTSYFRSGKGTVGSKLWNWVTGAKTSVIPTAVYVTEKGAVSEAFSSIGKKSEDVYKFFSSEKLQQQDLKGKYFVDTPTEIAHRKWNAYPRFSPPEKFGTFLPIAGERIYYPNAIESAVSALEVMAIGAKNAALLASRAVRGVHERRKQERRQKRKTSEL